MNQIILVSIAYVVAQMLSDVTSLKIIEIAGFSMDAGTLIYPITFTLRDLVHKIVGIKTTRLLIVTTAIVNIIMALVFWLVSILPPDMNVGLQTEFAVVLSPMWRIVIASIVAEVVSELIDTETYRLWTEHITKRFQWTRVLISNAFSIPIDSLLFCIIAFGGVYDQNIVKSIFLSNVIIKYIITFISLPAIYIVKENDI